MPADQQTSLQLWGIPFAVKDNIDVKGFRTTSACQDFAVREAETSAPAVQALLDAGLHSRFLKLINANKSLSS